MKKFLLPISYLLVILATVLGTLVFVQPQSAEGYKLLELENLLLEKFVDGAESQQLQDAAAHAMVEALGDRWSYYIPQEQYTSYVEDKNNSYVGIGVTIEQAENGYRVVRLTADGPAQKAGVAVNDVIIAVDGQSVAELSMDEGKALYLH